MQTSQVKKGTANRRSRKGKKDDNGQYRQERPPIDRRIPGWQSAVWDSSLGAWVKRPRPLRW